LINNDGFSFPDQDKKERGKKDGGGVAGLEGGKGDGDGSEDLAVDSSIRF